tara:strand:+ start:114 stop:956 length:843 start_codon:yes stop_codon:yes gene_type:complete
MKSEYGGIFGVITSRELNRLYELLDVCGSMGWKTKEDPDIEDETYRVDEYRRRLEAGYPQFDYGGGEFRDLAPFDYLELEYDGNFQLMTVPAFNTWLKQARNYAARWFKRVQSRYAQKIQLVDTKGNVRMKDYNRMQMLEDDSSIEPERYSEFEKYKDLYDYEKDIDWVLGPQGLLHSEDSEIESYRKSWIEGFKEISDCLQDLTRIQKNVAKRYNRWSRRNPDYTEDPADPDTPGKFVNPDFRYNVSRYRRGLSKGYRDSFKYLHDWDPDTMESGAHGL